MSVEPCEGLIPAQQDQNLNGHYIREAADDALVELILPRVPAGADRSLLLEAMPALKPRAKNLNELAEATAFLFAKAPLEMTEKAAKLLDDDGRARLTLIHDALAKENSWTIEALEATTKTLAEAQGLGLGKLAQPMRAALTGTTTSPGIFDVLVLLCRA